MKNLKKFNELNTYNKLTAEERREAINEIEGFISDIKLILDEDNQDQYLISQFDELVHNFKQIKSKSKNVRYTPYTRFTHTLIK